MTDERSKMLVEAMGEKWHDKELDHYEKQLHKTNRTFTDPADFFALWNWAKEQEWWYEFVLEFHVSGYIGDIRYLKWIDIIDPIRFPELLAEFLEERKESTNERT